MIFTNGGLQLFELISDIMLFLLKIHSDKESLTNIILFPALARVPEICITVVTDKEQEIKVDYIGSIYNFEERRKGLYYCDVAYNPTREAGQRCDPYVFTQK